MEQGVGRGNYRSFPLIWADVNRSSRIEVVPRKDHEVGWCANGLVAMAALAASAGTTGFAMGRRVEAAMTNLV